MTDRAKFEAWFEFYTGIAVEEHPSSNIIELVWQSWQAALASQQSADEGWIEWPGGERPVAREQRVETRYRRQGIVENDEARFFDWSHNDIASDIIAYRMVKP